jgi:hypothetical protein
MKCPRDGNPLASQKYESDIVVDQCPSCSGIWLDQGELEKAQSLLEHDYSTQLSTTDTVGRAYEMARQKARPAVSCPKCSQALHAEEYAYCSQILIDRCTTCRGIWCDAGEIQALEQFFEHQTEVGSGVRKGFWASLIGK